MSTQRRESWKVTEARVRRARHLSDEVMEWERLRLQDKYPRSLVDILEAALKREYEMGRRLRTHGRSSR